MKVLVTGATGFVGKYLVEELRRREMGVRILVRRSRAEEVFDDHDKVEVWHGDVTDPDSLAGIGENVDAVFHLAALGHVSAISQEAYRAFLAVNVQGTRNLMVALARQNVQRFVHFSSTAAMGLIRKRLVDECDTPNPATPYQRSKLESEKAALATGADLGIDTLVLRPCMIYGPGGFGEFYKIANLMKKGRFPKVGSGQNLTPLVHVRDVVQAAVKTLEKGRPGEVYLVTSSRSLPMDQLRRFIMDAWGCDALYPYVPTWFMYGAAMGFELLSRLTGRPPLATRRNIANTVWDREFSIAKSKSALGYEPAVDFEAGIHQTVAWYKEQSG